MMGRKIARQYRDALAEFVPDVFGNAFLVMTGSQIGIRETRRIIGDYVLSLDDYMARRSFDDEICRNSYFIDLHLTADEAKRNGVVDVEHRYKQYGPGESHGIPYRCLTPERLEQCPGGGSLNLVRAHGAWQHSRDAGVSGDGRGCGHGCRARAAKSRERRSRHRYKSSAYPLARRRRLFAHKGKRS
jgi:hypothetical protein